MYGGQGVVQYYDSLMAVNSIPTMLYYTEKKLGYRVDRERALQISKKCVTSDAFNYGTNVLLGIESVMLTGAVSLIQARECSPQSTILPW